jgi:Spy/CpxP family protein refolding chaperone
MTMNRGTTWLLTFLFFLVAAGVDEAAGQRPGRGPAERPSQSERGRALTALPSVDELAEAVKANPAQRAALAEARLAATQAPRGGRGEGRRVGGPLMVFVVEASRALDVEQTLALVDVLEQQDAGVRGMRGGPRAGAGRFERDGRGWPQRGSPRGERGTFADRADPLVDRLDLTQEQHTQLQALHGSTFGALGTLRRQADRAGAPTQAQLDEAERVRAEFESRLQVILTPEQSAQLATLRAERRAERRARVQERFEETKAQRLDDLTALLDLDTRQQAQVAEAIESTQAGLLARMQETDDEIGPLPSLFERPLERGREARDQAQDAIREVLRPQQRELLARLQALAPRGGPSANSDPSGPREGMRRRGMGPRGGK